MVRKYEPVRKGTKVDRVRRYESTKLLSKSSSFRTAPLDPELGRIKVREVLARVDPATLRFLDMARGKFPDAKLKGVEVKQGDLWVDPREADLNA